jgi:hypothetical protein
MLPCVHVDSHLIIDEAPSDHVAEHAAADLVRESIDEGIIDPGGLEETSFAAGGGSEDSLGDDAVIVKMLVKCRARPVDEGDGTEARLGRRIGAGLPDGGLDGAQEDTQHRSGVHGVAVQEVAEPLRKGEHPLAIGDTGQDVVHEVGGGPDHVLGTAGRAKPLSLATEGREKLIPAG